MDGAAGTVKFDACRLEFEAAEIQYSSHCRLEAVHHVLVLDSQDLPGGQHALPMCHETDVHPVVTADVFLAVGEPLAIGK
jgi:hypothetical protein